MKAESDLLLSIANDTQNEYEQVDQIQVKLQGSDSSYPADSESISLHHGLRGHLLDFFGIVDGQAHEDNHSGKRHQPFQSSALKEHVGEGR